MAGGASKLLGLALQQFQTATRWDLRLRGVTVRGVQLERALVIGGLTVAVLAPIAAALTHSRDVLALTLVGLGAVLYAERD